MKKKIISSVIFLVIIIAIVINLNRVVLDKTYNRYYIMSQEIKDNLDNGEEYDVQVYGSCHAYTSFDTKMFGRLTGNEAYNMANPSEIIPVTYLRMREIFKKQVPDIVFVETWGINPDNTYIDESTILGDYMLLNLQDVPFSIDKVGVINDYHGDWGILDTEIFLRNYKKRIVEQTVYEYDYNYSFETLSDSIDYADPRKWIINDMSNRISNDGYLENGYNKLKEYPGEKLKGQNIKKCTEPDERMIKYLDKIVHLCKENHVKLVFYKAPFSQTKEEIEVGNWLTNYCKENEVMYYDTEEYIDYSVETDFIDEAHLSFVGADKMTIFFANELENINEFYEK